MKKANPLLILLSLVSIFINDVTCGPAFWNGRCAYRGKTNGEPWFLSYSPPNYNTSNNTPDICLTTCEEAGYAFAGLTRHSYCSCGNHADRILPDNHCQAKCSGDPGLICGRTNLNYWATIYSVLSTETWRIAYSQGRVAYNEHTQERAPDGSLLLSIPVIGKEWSVNHDFNATEYSTDFGNDTIYSSLYLSAGEDNETLVAIYFHNSYGMKIEYSLNSNTFFHIVPSIDVPKINEWTNIDIYQAKLAGKYVLNIGMAGESIVSVENFKPREFHNVRLFRGDPRRASQPGFIRDLHVLTKTEDCCDKMTVGGVTYQLQGMGDMTAYNCVYNCIYTSTKPGDNNQYCFGAGDDAPQCGAPASTTKP